MQILSFDLWLFGPWGRNGHAFMFRQAMNVTTGAKENIQHMMGLHMFAGIHSLYCRELLAGSTREPTRNRKSTREVHI
jgi:hypothetical protein